MQFEFRWIVPATVLVAAEQLACLFLHIGLKIKGWPPYLNYGKFAVLALAVTSAVVLVHALLLCRAARPKSPLAHVLEYFSVRRARLRIFAWGVFLAYLQLTCLTWTKSLLPLVSTLWADRSLADLDFWFFGVDPWRTLLPILAPVGPVVDFLYAMWLPFVMLMIAAVLFSPGNRRKATVVLSFFTITALTGVFGQFLLPSGGPIYWTRLGLGDRFAALPVEPHTGMMADYLWQRFVGDVVDFGTGISAFPSMHVALTAWMVFAIHALFPRLKPLAWFYFVVILVGSVYLGWHYLVDGIGGAAGAIACWYLAAKLVRADSGINQIAKARVALRMKGAAIASPTRSRLSPGPRRSPEGVEFH